MTDADPTKAERLKSVYLSVTGGDTDPVVEPQRQDSNTRDISNEQVPETVGPAEHHGLGDAIDEPDPD